jgi:hypothetical protein
MSWVYFSNLFLSQEHGFLHRVILQESLSCLGVLADLAINILDLVGGVNDLAHLRKGKEDSQPFPVIVYV